MVGGVLRTALYTNYGLRMAASRPEKGGEELMEKTLGGGGKNG
jgi:hypothetical protein